MLSKITKWQRIRTSGDLRYGLLSKNSRTNYQSCTFVFRILVQGITTSMDLNQSGEEKLENLSDLQIRDTLFGDLPFEDWPGEATDNIEAEPWRSFAIAGKQNAAGDLATAKSTLQDILRMTDLESRHYLQAWHFLRQMNEQPPPEEAKHVYGVVVEVALEDGLDIVAAYEDLSARYFNYSGAAIIWEHPDNSLDENTKALLQAGQTVAAQIGPWDGPRPPAPDSGQARINMLTPAGLHFGQAPYDALAADPLGGTVMRAALQLMQGLIIKSGRDA